MIKEGQRVRVIKCSRDDLTGMEATAIEDEMDNGRTRGGIPVRTVYIRFAVPVLSDQGPLVNDIEMPADQLEVIHEPA